MSDHEKALEEFAMLVPSKEGENPEQYQTRIRFLYRVSDWSEAGAIRVYRDSSLLGPTSAPLNGVIRARCKTPPVASRPPG